ncbi:MAG TPA: sodium:solute symporter [candidate division Zixibacteria bacterium]|nr:sodium:solute symporter [candidate division Zixibacteria bacterium]HBZ00986.1 sodium:solute symporter [candidate division Zixibacteria bacterium]
MNLSILDWAIVFISLGLMIFSVEAGRRVMKSVADFLSAGRSAGRYVLCVASGAAGIGAITVVGNLEMNLIAGFSLTWWNMTTALVVLIITVSGWVVYRFRETRSLTLAQYFEARYSREFRIFTGLVAFLSGIVNFGIFPAVEARFFIYFCGLPDSIALFGFHIATFPLMMLFLLGISLYFVLGGGQVSVIYADFFQGVLVYGVFVILVVYFFISFDWGHVTQALAAAPQNASLINPFKTSQVKDFNFWYFLVGIIGVIYGTMSWQGTQAYNSSAKSAHEAKMANVLTSLRNLPMYIMFLFVPIIAYTVLNHPDFSSISGAVSKTLSGIDGKAVQSQLKVPLVLARILPRGLIGAFAAMMLAASISTLDAYMHSWGSIIVQDVIMPLRKRPFEPKQHLTVLRWAIAFVGVFAFFFSLIFRQSEYIFLFFAITGAIFAGGSGAVIIGGLYWKRGTTTAAWSAMITGSGIAVAGIIIHQITPDFFINGQWFWGISMLAASIVYIGVSLLGKKEDYNFDSLLHRGKYAVVDETKIISEVPSRGWKLLGMGKEFTRGDKFIYILNYVWTGGWLLVFIVGTIYNLTHNVSDESWLAFWRIYLVINVVVSSVIILWFLIGGFRDLTRMNRRLELFDRDHRDDGFVNNPKGNEEEGAA